MEISEIGSSFEEPESDLFQKALEHPACGQLRLLCRVEEVSDRYARCLEHQTQQGIDESAALDRKKQEMLRKEEEWAISRKTWNVSAVGTQYLASATTLALGGAALTTAPVSGGLLIASAVVGLANRILQDTGAMHAFIRWAVPEESQRSWIYRSEVTLCSLSLGLGLAGGISAYQADALFNEGLQGTIGKVVATAAGVSGAVAQVGKSHAEWHLAHLQADMKETDTRMVQIDQESNTDFQHIQRMIGTVREIGDHVKQTITQTTS